MRIATAWWLPLILCGCLVKSQGASTAGPAGPVDPGVVARLVQFGGMQSGRAQALASAVQSGLAANANRGGQDYDRIRIATAQLLFGESGPGQTQIEYQQRHSQVLLRLYRGLDPQLLEALFRAPESVAPCQQEFGLSQDECAALHAAATRVPRVQPALAQARAAFAAGNYALAAQLYQQATAQNPADPLAHAGLGKSRMALGDRAGAAVAFQTALRYAPQSRELRQLLAQAQGGAGAAPAPSGRFGAARPVAVQPAARPAAPAADPTQMVRQGDMHFGRKAYLTALNAYQRADRAKPGDPNIQLRIAKAYEALGQPGRALKSYEALVKSAPYNIEYNVKLADALLAAGKLDEARKRYENVLGLQSNNHAARKGLAAIDRRQRKAKARAKKPAKTVVAKKDEPAASPPAAPEAAGPVSKDGADGKAAEDGAAPKDAQVAEAAGGKGGDEGKGKGKGKAGANGEAPDDAEAPGGEPPPQDAPTPGEGSGDDDLIGDLLDNPMGD